MSWKHLFARTLNPQSSLHFAAHSHHPWPDASRDAHMQYWDDTARMLDHKWGYVFSDIIPAVQKHIAGHLRLSNPSNIAFAPNTHEFVNRLLSCLPDHPRILTTDGEFHSFNRQVTRLEEDGRAHVTRIAVEPFDTFPKRFAAAAAEHSYDMVFFSHVFFNSGYAVPDLNALVGAVKTKESFVVIDGYHGFMARDTDLSAIEGRAFYLAGGYKYAMAGEGVCFMHCPKDFGERPRNTGWFADMGALENAGGAVGYAGDGYRFWGATFDPSGLYRMKAVMDMLGREGLNVPAMHNYVRGLQDYFIDAVAPLHHAHINDTNLVTPVASGFHGRFLTYRTDQAGALQEALTKNGIITDHRGDRLRFGFGIYHDRDDIDRLVRGIERIAP